MPTSLRRGVGVIGSVLGAFAATLVWAAQPASAHNECLTQLAADSMSVSASCPSNSMYLMLFRVVTYPCAMPNAYCSSQPVYGNWAEVNGGTSQAVTAPSYVNTSRIYIEYQYAD